MMKLIGRIIHKKFTGIVGHGVTPDPSAWETLIDQTVTSRVYGNYGYIGADISLLTTDYPLFTQPCRVRLTVDGIATVLNCEVSSGDISGVERYNYHIGNKSLRHSDYADDGYNFYLEGSWNPLGRKYVVYFYSRAIGTYNVKLEKEI